MKNWTPRLAEANLRQKLQRNDFHVDLGPLVIDIPQEFDIETATQQLLDELILRVDDPGFALEPEAQGSS